MKWIDILGQALNNLLRRKLRSALTMLGVVIGTAAIVVTISLGYGAEKTQMEALEGYTNLRVINVFPYYGGYGSDGTTTGNRITKINDSVLSRIRRCNGVEAVTPLVNIWINAEFAIQTGKLENRTYLTGVLPKDFAKIMGLKSGNYFTGSTDRMEFLMSELALMEFKDPKKGDDYTDYWTMFFDGKELPLPKVNWFKSNYKLFLRYDDYSEASNDPEAEVRTIENEFKAKMQGIINPSSNDWDFLQGAIVNLNWVKRFQRDNRKLCKELGWEPIVNYDRVYVLARSTEEVETAVRELTDMGLQPSSMLDTVKNFRDQIRTMQGFLGFIGVVTMLVAALSIMNTMMMSIYERTREIGVMKVLGCRLGNIRLMFLSEAAYIGVFGGAIGLILSYLLSYLLNNVPWLQQIVAQVMSSSSSITTEGGTTSIIPWQLAGLTWLGVLVVSIVSGIRPAQHAMSLSSLEAIRSAE